MADKNDATTREFFVEQEIDEEPAIKAKAIAEARTKIKPTSDVFARYLFSFPTNIALTKSFINAVLEDAGKPQIASLQIISPFNLRKSVQDKESVVDVKVSEQDGKSYDIEIQTTTTETLWNRITYYNNSMFNDQLGDSEDYNKLKPSVVIAVLEKHIYNRLEKVMPEEKMHHFSQTMHGDNHSAPFFPLGDVETYHILELDRFDFNENALYTVDSTMKRKLGENLFHWLRFLMNGAQEDFMQAYNETNTTIKKAKDTYENFIADRQLREAQFEHEMAMHDLAQAKTDARTEGYNEGHSEGYTEGHSEGYADGHTSGHAEGRAEGHAEGEHEKALAIAQNMKKLNIPDDIISKATNLPAEEIARLS